MLRRMRVVETEELEQVHHASLAVLQETGMVVDHDMVLAQLGDNGCQVDLRTRLVRFDPDLVMAQLKKAPSSIVLGGRDHSHDLVLGEEVSEPILRPALGLEQLLDYRTGQVREGGTDDLIEWIMLADALPHIGFAAVSSPCDVHIASRDVTSAAIAVQHTSKHLHVLAYSGESVDSLASIAEITAGSREEARRRPPLSFFQVSIPPLQLDSTAVDKILAAGRNGIPLFLNSSPIMGATAPISIGGCVALLNAEILAMNCILQISYPGSPMVYTSRPSAMDMRTMQSCWGAIEVSLAAALSVQLAKELYGLPTDAYGPSTESKILDTQAAMEKAKTAFLPAMAGSDIVSGAGNIESQITMSLPQMILDNELFQSISRMLRGITITESDLGVDVIREVGPKGHFLTAEHTLQRLRHSLEPSDIFDRAFRGIWAEQGQPVMERVHIKLEQLLREHRVPPLSDGQVDDIRRVVEDLSVRRCR